MLKKLFFKIVKSWNYREVIKISNNKIKNIIAACSRSRLISADIKTDTAGKINNYYKYRKILNNIYLIIDLYCPILSDTRLI